MSKSKKTRVRHDIIAVQFPICSFNMTLKGPVGKVDPRGQFLSMRALGFIQTSSFKVGPVEVW